MARASETGSRIRRKRNRVDGAKWAHRRAVRKMRQRGSPASCATRGKRRIQAIPPRGAIATETWGSPTVPASRKHRRPPRQGAINKQDDPPARRKRVAATTTSLADPGAFQRPSVLRRSPGGRTGSRGADPRWGTPPACGSVRCNKPCRQQLRRCMPDGHSADGSWCSSGYLDDVQRLGTFMRARVAANGGDACVQAR